ncbi:contractile injection system tape measure protein [Foetidibacter luteolus]|uniref:contractile injection system tape measure protein n=1 Tax=Foetidibacter luteolus TaxID=2608880 RepID=UPI00129BD1C8|nr:contractile injection system tape measure protein [Foetidibacter luteolus]
MPTVQQHIIQKQVLEVEMQAPPDAFAFRNRLGELYNYHIYPALEDVFNAVCPGESYIVIEKLVIDIGELNYTNWETDVVAKTLLQLKNELLLHKESYMYSANRQASVAGNTVTGTGLGKEKNMQQGQHNVGHFIESFIYFLQQGVLPWNAAPVAAAGFEEMVMQAIEEQPGVLVAALQRFLAGAEDAEIKRLVYQLPQQALEKITVLLLKHYAFNHRRHEKLNETLGSVIAFSAGETKVREVLHQAFFATITRAGHHEDAFRKALCLRVMAMLPGEKQALPGDVSDLLTQMLTGLDITFNESAAGLAGSSQSSPDVSHKRAVKKSSVNELYIQNAGLVLLHPFLFALFTHAGYLNGDKMFKDEDAASAALLLSQYLATGEKHFPEYELPLNKILCGFPPGMPVKSRLEADDAVFEEAETLLQQVCVMWKMNGTPVNMSNAGLRSSFLQRAGKLSYKENNWLLQVEQKTYDVVLSSLPWGIGVIKNELMTDMLWVEWT